MSSGPGLPKSDLAALLGWTELDIDRRLAERAIRETRAVLTESELQALLDPLSRVRLYEIAHSRGYDLKKGIWTLAGYPALVTEWHPTKNQGRSPRDVDARSRAEVWWRCAKGPDHEWQSAPRDRTMQNKSCPFCAGQRITVTNCLATVAPDVARQWHPTRNGSLRPEQFTSGSGHRAYWKCPEGPDHEWATAIGNRAERGTGCPFCLGKRASVTNSLAVTHPGLAAELHPTKNGDLRAEDLVAGSSRRVWWICGQGHEWEAQALVRGKLGHGCVVCARKVVSSLNSVAVQAPHLAEQLHPTKNGSLGADQIAVRSNKPIWWKCSLGADHEWLAAPADRTRRGKGGACPFCRGRRPSVTTSVAARFPNEWHSTKNGHLRPENLYWRSDELVWWQCKNNPEHAWRASPFSRARGNRSCPECNPKRATRGGIARGAEPDASLREATADRMDPEQHPARHRPARERHYVPPTISVPEIVLRLSGALRKHLQPATEGAVRSCHPEGLLELAALCQQAAIELRRVLDTLNEALPSDPIGARAGDPVDAAPRVERTSPEDASVPIARDWAAIVGAAISLITSEPSGTWDPRSLARALRERGIETGSLRGMTLALTARLRERGVHLEKDGTFSRPRELRAGASDAPESMVRLAASEDRTATPSESLEAAMAELEDEVFAVAPFLGDESVSRSDRTAQVAVWAGRTRSLEARCEGPDLDRRLKRLFRKLVELARELGCNWIDALDRGWSIEDWSIYVLMNRARVHDLAPEVSADRVAFYYRALLRGLSSPHRWLDPGEVHERWLEAHSVLPPDDPVLQDVARRFGIVSSRAPSPHERRRTKATSADPVPRRTLAPEVLALTRGKRILVVGGQGARPEHRQAFIETFEPAELEWIVTERGQASPFVRLTGAVRPDKYDFVVFLTGFTSHQSSGFLRACKQNGIPVVYVNGGYSVASLAEAVAARLGGAQAS